MTGGEIALIVAAAAFVLGVIIWQIVRRKKGKTGCDCCSDCCSCGHCSKQKSETKKSQNS